MSDPLDTSAAHNAFGDAAGPTSPGDEGQGWVPHSAAEFGTDLAAAHPRYRVIEYMKHGGMGAVYRCTDSEKGGREVVVKVMRWDRMHSKDFVARFRRERDMLSKLDHPHIVPCLDMGETADGYPFFVMPYLTGVLLEHYTRDRPPLPRGQARAFCIRILQELCAALGDLHENGGIHRDVKPSNIFLVGREESVRLLDLGILRLLDPTDGIHTMLGDRPGTQRYLAPEVMANRPADERADIYSLGVIALQLLTGHYPEPGYAKPSEFGHDPRFDAIIEKAINPYPADRYESTAKFAEALSQAAIENVKSHSLSLWTCPTCATTISKTANSCPQCGEDLLKYREITAWHEHRCRGCKRPTARFSKKCHHEDCRTANRWLVPQTSAATAIFMTSGFFFFAFHYSNPPRDIIWIAVAMFAGLAWRGTLYILEYFYGRGIS